MQLDLLLSIYPAQIFLYLIPGCISSFAVIRTSFIFQLLWNDSLLFTAGFIILYVVVSKQQLDARSTFRLKSLCIDITQIMSPFWWYRCADFRWLIHLSQSSLKAASDSRQQAYYWWWVKCSDGSIKSFLSRFMWQSVQCSTAILLQDSVRRHYEMAQVKIISQSTYHLLPEDEMIEFMPSILRGSIHHI